jgi:hypothetical protein
LLKYKETNWKYERGFATCKYDLAIGTILASITSKEQQAKIEKLSLVAFLNREQRKVFCNICRRLKRNNNSFYQNKNLHATLFGFGPINKKDYETIEKTIHAFTRKKRHGEIIISFNEIRPGTMYLKNKVGTPIHGMSNGTVIAAGDVPTNKDFYNYSNQLGSFLLKDKKIESILGSNFRRKFPMVWCTLGYYKKKNEFKIDKELEGIFKKYNNLQEGRFKVPLYEIALVESKYKNLRYPKLVQKYRV